MDRDFLLKKALYLTKKGYYRQALKAFEEHGLALRPVPLSYYALCVAAEERDYEKAISECVKAVKSEFYTPEVYVNLGRILAKSGRKAVAFRAYRKGLAIDGTHRGLIREMKAMGLRRRPLIAFLSRDNPVNRSLGMLASLLHLRAGDEGREDEKLLRSRYYRCDKGP